MSLPAYRYARLLGLGHKARQGKDLAAKLLMREFPGRVLRVAFADALKAHCRIAHGMTQKDGPLLQRVGVAARASDEDVWIRAAAWTIAEFDADAREPFIVCIPDTRFPNEAAFVEARGVTCRVRRVTDSGLYVDPSRPATHESETALDGYAWGHSLDVRDGDLAALSAAVREVGAWLLRDEAQPLHRSA